MDILWMAWAISGAALPFVWLLGWLNMKDRDWVNASANEKLFLRILLLVFLPLGGSFILVTAVKLLIKVVLFAWA